MKDKEKSHSEIAREILNKLNWYDSMELCSDQDMKNDYETDVQTISYALSTAVREERGACEELANEHAKECEHDSKFVSVEEQLKLAERILGCYKIATAIRQRR